MTELVSNATAWLNMAASRNMFMVITFVVSRASGWSKALALRNMKDMWRKLRVSNASGLLNKIANMADMDVTLLVSKESARLKTKAELNKPLSAETLLVSQALMSSLKPAAEKSSHEEWAQNSLDISVTRLTSHADMGPKLLHRGRRTTRR